MTNKQTNARTKKVSSNQRHIVAIGGALSKVPSGCGQKQILEYLFNLQPNRKTQRILVINTATGDAKSSEDYFYNSWNMLNKPCSLTFLNLFARTPPDLKALLLSQDIIFVGGGNTKSMLAVWREYGIDKLLHQAWKLGIVLAGSSAGGICWFDSCLTDSYAETYTSLKCLGILKGSCCPHYDGEIGRRETYQAMVESQELANGYAIDEATAIHFVGKKIHKVISVSTNEYAAAYLVSKQYEGVKEIILPAERLNESL
ncbi:MAG: peptidase E [Candidatus Obscuribacterales bacterium]